MLAKQLKDNKVFSHLTRLTTLATAVVVLWLLTLAWTLVSSKYRHITEVIYLSVFTNLDFHSPAATASHLNPSDVADLTPWRNLGLHRTFQKLHFYLPPYAQWLGNQHLRLFHLRSCRALPSMTLYVTCFVEPSAVKSKLERLRFASNGQRRLSATTNVGTPFMSNHGRDVNRSFYGLYKYLLQMIRVLLLCSPLSTCSISTQRQLDSSDHPPPKTPHH